MMQCDERVALWQDLGLVFRRFHVEWRTTTRQVILLARIYLGVQTASYITQVEQ